MSKTIIAEGRTTNEAIEKGLKELGVSRDRVEIKVLEDEKRSFFSILTPRVVKIEMTLKDDIEQKIDKKSSNKVKKEIHITLENQEKAKKNVEEFLKDFIKNYLNENKIPQFIKNSDAYKSGVALAKKQFEDLKKSWLAELEDEKNAGTLSEEEFNKIKNNLNLIDENFEDVGNDYSNRIDEIDVRPGSLDVTPVDMCSNESTSLKVFQVIGYLLIIIKIIVPLILIIMGSIDFAKAALSGDDKSTKEAAVQFSKRVLIGLIVFFIPTILDFFLSLISGASETASKYNNCTNCILNPNNKNKCNPKGLTE